MALSEKLQTAWEIGEGLFTLGFAIFKAIKDGDEAKVDEILPEQNKNTLVRILRDAEAVIKFGPRPDDESGG